MAVHLTRAFTRLCIAALSTALLTQCSSVEQAERDQSSGAQPDISTPIDTQYPDVRSATAWLEQARQAQSEPQQIMALTQAALAFQASQQWQQSAAILSQLSPRKMRPADYPGYQLALSQWLANQQQWQAVIDTLAPVVQQLNQREYRLRALKLIANSHAELGQYWQAAAVQVDAEQYNGDAQPEQRRDAIWRYLRLVPSEQLPAARPLSNQLAGWWRLAKIFHQSAQSIEEIPQLLTRWQTSFPNHLATALVSEWSQQTWKNADTVVALLPLSGPFAKQGIAVRDGLIMAATAANADIRFIDTHTTSVEQQYSKIIETNTLHVIGPLLKTNVRAWKDKPLPGVYHLLLNETGEVGSAITGHSQLEFALAPEDEAAQAAQYLATHSDRTPLILASRSGSSERMIESFQQQRQLLNQPPAETGWYQSRDQMQTLIEHQLGIEGSKARIREVKIAAGKIIIDEQERSRADIDAIYLPGNLPQVRLLKPFIDVNLSPFTPPLTVYASSNVHERSNRNGDSDLPGIQFTDSPVLFEAHPQHALTEQWLTLRPDASLNEARLLAMGYDSLSLINQAGSLQHFPGIARNGFSGQLSVPFGRVQRQLNWAIFRAQDVQRIE